MGVGATPFEPSPSRASGSSSKRAREQSTPSDPNNSTLFIGGIASFVTEEVLRREFSAFGVVEGVKLPHNKTGFGFVRFKSRAAAERAKKEISGNHYASLNPNKAVRLEWASEQVSLSCQREM